MNYLQVVVFVPVECEEILENELKKQDLVCLYFIRVRGYGCHPNYFSRNWFVQFVKFELIIKEDRLDSIKYAVKSSCQVGSEDDGFISVTSLGDIQAIKNL
ncbi:hypothetical protein [Litoribacillus peritrichatus]|uniref:Nitrogen regulatory protein P-II n=1 Tax=Litoribacillus peritrichatus TaxID=718191 RepID=A0ABP7MVN5_9GAMM